MKTLLKVGSYTVGDRSAMIFEIPPKLAALNFGQDHAYLAKLPDGMRFGTGSIGDVANLVAGELYWSDEPDDKSDVYQSLKKLNAKLEPILFVDIVNPTGFLDESPLGNLSNETDGIVFGGISLVSTGKENLALCYDQGDVKMGLESEFDELKLQRANELDVDVEY